MAVRSAKAMLPNETFGTQTARFGYPDRIALRMTSLAQAPKAAAKKGAWRLERITVKMAAKAGVAELADAPDSKSGGA